MFDFQFYLYNFTKLLPAHCHNERKLVANAKQWLCKRSHFIPRNSHHHCAHPPRPRPLHCDCPFTAMHQGRLLFTFQIYHRRKAHTRITQCVALAKTHPLWMPRLLHWSIRAAPSCRHTLMDARSSRNCVRAKRAPWLSTHKDIGVHIRLSIPLQQHRMTLIRYTVYTHLYCEKVACAVGVVFSIARYIPCVEWMETQQRETRT